MKLSFILPVLNEQDLITASLDRLQSYRRRGHEVIVVDGGSEDGTVAEADPLADRVLHSLPGRSRQMNRGAAAASGDWLLFLHADTVLPERVDDLVDTASAGGSHLWLWFDVRFSNPGWPYRVIAWFMNRRARLTRVCTGDQALVVARRVFQAEGGFPDIPLMEDVALSKRLRLEGKPAVIGTPVIASSRRWERQGVFSAILMMWWLRLRYFLGADPAQLARRYYPDLTERLLAPGQCHYPKGRLAVFAREPVLGEVKTRLAESLGDEPTLRLYEAMLGYMVAMASDQCIAPVSLWVTANPDHGYFQSLCPRDAIQLQGEGDLGRRMDHTGSTLLACEGVDGVVIVGSDCPAIDGLYLMEAFDALARGNDLVLGPAEDGGYILVGLSKPLLGLFEDIEWGSDQVLTQTLERANALGLRYVLLNTLWDVDRTEDVARLGQLSTDWHSLLAQLERDVGN